LSLPNLSENNTLKAKTTFKNMRAQILSINHVTLIVDNLETATQFYREELGLESLPSLDFDYPVEFFRINDKQQLHLSEWPDQPSYRGHVCFVSCDFNSLFHRFKSLNCIEVEAWGKVRRLADGALQMFARDPAGNLLEFSAPPGYALDPAIEADKDFFQQDGDVFVSGRNDARGTRGEGGTLYHK